MAKNQKDRVLTTIRVIQTARRVSERLERLEIQKLRANNERTYAFWRGHPAESERAGRDFKRLEAKVIRLNRALVRLHDEAISCAIRQ